jgi:hypothetical protein
VFPINRYPCYGKALKMCCHQNNFEHKQLTVRHLAVTLPSAKTLIYM